MTTGGAGRTLQRMVGTAPGRVAVVLLLPLLLLGCGGVTSAPPPATPRGGPLGDTWTFDGGDWARAAGPGPAARFDTAMAYDEARQVTILFGGSGLLDQFDDTWSWDGSRWSRLHPIHHPVAISGHEMAYDAARRLIVLFGGAHGLYEKANPSKDTWTWDGQDWTMVSSGGPPSLNGQRMSFYPPTGQLILFGGSSGNTRYSDQTWAWDGRQWTLAEPALHPSPSYGGALAFDPASGALVLFGGAELKPDVGPGEAGLPVADQWAFSGGQWSALHPASTPGPRANAAFARDPTRPRVILFSGTSCPFGNQTWAWNGREWTRLHPSRSPQARAYAAVATDVSRARVVLFGGLADTPCL